MQRKFTKFQVGDLVRRYRIGEYEHMFAEEARDLGIIISTSHGRNLQGGEVHVYWNALKETSYYNQYAAEDKLILVSKKSKNKNHNIYKED